MIPPAIPADPADPDDFDVSADGLAQAIADRTARRSVTAAIAGQGRHATQEDLA